MFKKISLFVLILCGMLAFSTIVTPMPVMAKSPEQEDEAIKKANQPSFDLPGITDVLDELNKSGYESENSGLVQAFLAQGSGFVGCFVGVSNMFGNVMSDCFSSTGSTSIAGVSFTALTLLSGRIITALKPAAWAISVCFFLIALLSLAMEDRFTLDLFIRFFAKLAVSFAAIFYSDKIATYIADFGDALASFIAGITALPTADGKTSPVSVAASLYEKVDTIVGSSDSSKLGIAIGFMIMVLVLVVVCSLAMVALTIAVYWYAASRLIELCVRACFLPIALALLSDDGWRGAGGRYVRKYLAIASQGAVLVMIGKASQALITSAIMLIAADASTIGGLIGQFLLTIALVIAIAMATVKLMGSSIQIINDVFGG